MDINLFREEKGGNPELVRESQRRRHKDVSVVDKVIELDEVWRKRRYDRDQINKEFNKLNKEIAQKRKAKEDATELQEKSKALKKQIEVLAEVEKEAAAARDKTLGSIGNIVHAPVPVAGASRRSRVRASRSPGRGAHRTATPTRHGDGGWGTSFCRDSVR